MLIINTTFLLATLALILIFLFALATLIPLFAGLMKGAPYVPSNRKRQEIMMKFANLKPGEKAIDLGSGDGRLVIALAEAGAKESVGYEINPWLVWLSKINIRSAGVERNTRIYRKNFSNVDISEFDVIMLYLLPATMSRLETRIQSQLKPGARVVSNAFQFPNWQPSQTEDEVRLYTKP